MKRAEGIVQIKLKIFADFEISGNRRTLRERELHAAQNRHCACSRQINRSEVFHVQIARAHRFRVGIRQIPEVDVVSGFVQVTEVDAERDRRGRIFLGLNRAVIFEARGNAENRIIADPEIDVRAGHRSAVFDFRRSGKTSFKAEIVFIGIDRSCVHEFRVFAERNINVVGGGYAPIDDRSRIFKNRIPRKPKIDAADFPGGGVDELRVPEKIVAHTLDVIVRLGGNRSRVLENGVVAQENGKADGFSVVPILIGSAGRARKIRFIRNRSLIGEFRRIRKQNQVIAVNSEILLPFGIISAVVFRRFALAAEAHRRVRGICELSRSRERKNGVDLPVTPSMMRRIIVTVSRLVPTKCV